MWKGPRPLLRPNPVASRLNSMEGTHTLRKDVELTIRRARADAIEAMELLVYLKKISVETENTYMVPEEINRMTVDSELAFLESSLTDGQLFLVAETGNEIVGSLGIHRRMSPRTLHRCEIGVSVLKEHWGFGIARRMMEAMLEWARQEEMRKVELRVRVDNHRAIKLYERMGFVQEGQHRNAMRVGRSYCDEISMGLWIEPAPPTS
jgi:RimJ/RimL family protein N-acetyltransferase